MQHSNTSEKEKEKKKRSDFFWIPHAPTYPTIPHHTFSLSLSSLGWLIPFLPLSFSLSLSSSFFIFYYYFFIISFFKHSSHSLTLSHRYHSTPPFPPSVFRQDHQKNFLGTFASSHLLFEVKIPNFLVGFILFFEVLLSKL